MTQIRRITGTKDLIPLVPHLTGMTPADSVILIPLAHGRTRGAMRINRPTGHTPRTVSALAGHLIGMLCNLEHADSVLPLIYTPERVADAGDDLVLLAALVERAGAAGFHVPDGVLVGADGWIDLDSDPNTPHPMPSSTSTADLPPVPDSKQASRLTPIDPAAREALETDRHHARIIAAAAFHGFDPTDTIEEAISSSRPSALLATAAAVPALRDLVLLQTGWGQTFGHDAWRRTLLDTSPLEADEPTAIAYRGGNIRRPDIARIRTLIAALQATAPGATDTERTGIAAMLAWLHWTLGCSTIAGRLAATVLEQDPGHGLGCIIDTLVRTSTLPEWAWREQPRPRPGHPTAGPDASGSAGEGSTPRAPPANRADARCSTNQVGRVRHEDARNNRVPAPPLQPAPESDPPEPQRFPSERTYSGVSTAIAAAAASSTTVGNPDHHELRTIVWASENALSARRTALQTGQPLRALAHRATSTLPQAVLHGLPEAARPEWHLYLEPDTGQSAESLQSLNGDIAEILAITSRHRQSHPGRWEPTPGSARARPVTSTCAPDPARSVWIPSGNPVLLGFLLTIDHTRRSRRIG